MRQIMGPLLALSTLCYALSVGPANAQRRPTEPDIDEDEPVTGSLLPTQEQSSRPLREVVRGTFVQVVPGSMRFLGVVADPYGLYPFGYGMNWGNVFSFHGGMDLTPEGPLSFSVEAAWWESFNGISGSVVGYSTAQGSTRTSLLEVAARPALMFGPSRRWGAYARLGGGVSIFHQQTETLPLGTNDYIYSSPTYGFKPKPTLTLGGGLEYFTRLAHFSFTFFEVQAVYVVGVDWGVALNGAGFKYTF